MEKQVLQAAADDRIDPPTPDKGGKPLSGKAKINLIVAIATVAIVIVALAIAIPIGVVLGNPLRTANVDKIALGATEQDVVRVMGEPQSRGEDGKVWLYYNGVYDKHLQGQNVAVDAKAKLCTITFADGAVSQVVYDASKPLAESTEAKQIKESSLLTCDEQGQVDIAQQTAVNISYRTRYADGSLIKGSAQGVPVYDETECEILLTWQGAFGQASAVYDGFEYYYRAADGLATVLRAGKKIADQAIVPDRFGDNTVVAIGNYAFEQRGAMTSVQLPATLASIGDYAFHNCRALTDVVLPESVTYVGDYAFRLCTSLQAIRIPATVEYMGQEVFFACHGAMKIQSETASQPGWWHDEWNRERPIPVEWAVDNLPDDSVKADYRYVLHDGEAYLTKYSGKDTVVVVPSQVDGHTVVALIGTFGNPEDCGEITEITVPASVRRIDDYTFVGCAKLTQVHVDAANPAYTDADGVVYTKDMTRLVCVPAGNARTSYAIADTVTRIGGKALFGCADLTSVTIPSGVVQIGDYAFEGCKRLATVSVPASVTRIGNGAFRACEALAQIQLAEGLTQIGNQAFAQCTSLRAIVIPASVAQTGRELFIGCSKLEVCCVAASEPDGWHNDWKHSEWRSSKCTVKWGYQG